MSFQLLLVSTIALANLSIYSYTPASALAGVDMRLEPGAIRYLFLDYSMYYHGVLTTMLYSELHWHKTAEVRSHLLFPDVNLTSTGMKWAYVLKASSFPLAHP